ncbi:TIGR00180 family glycosyltransferase [Gammaproteobacteria bacterium]|nr:TIGR00180 family glycosyltransferase [Gammaproteobacteria bacterium]
MNREFEIGSLEDITLLFFTKNRVEFMLRALDYYNTYEEAHAITIIISDASDEHLHLNLLNKINKKNYKFPLNLIHHQEKNTIDEKLEPYTYLRRLKDSMRMVKTKYILMGADDDFYYFDWMRPAMNILEIDDQMGAVYGHALKFTLDSFLPRGVIQGFEIGPEDNPPFRDYDDDDVAVRLETISQDIWASQSWYSLQKTSVLNHILTLANKHGIDGNLFEYLVSFVHSVVYKSTKVDKISIARQVDFIQRQPPLSYKRNTEEIKSFIAACAEVLRIDHGFSYDESELLALKAFSKNIEYSKIADRKEPLRKLKLLFPWLEKFANPMSRKIARQRFSSHSRNLPSIKDAEQETLQIIPFIKQ